MKRLFVCLFVVFVLVVVVEDSVSAKEAGITDTTIKVGVITALTGPVAGIGKICGEGAKIAYQQANAQGGVHGKKFELILEDNAYDPGRCIAAYKKLTARDRVFAIGPSVGTPPSAAIIKLANKDKVPLLIWMGADSFFTPPKRYVFMVGMSYRLEITGLVEYAMDNLDLAKKKVGYLYQDDEGGVAGNMAMDDVSKAYGINVVSRQSFKRGAPDVSPQLLALKKAGAQVVFVATNARDIALVFKKSMEMNYKPTYIGLTSSVDQSIFNILPAGDIDFYAGAVMAPLSSDCPGMRKYRESGKKYRPDFKPRSFHFLGYAPAMVFIEACRAAGPDLTREKLVDALEGFSNLDLGGLIPPVTYGKLRRFSASSVPILKMDTKEKKFKLIRGPKEVRLNPYKH